MGGMVVLVYMVNLGVDHALFIHLSQARERGFHDKVGEICVLLNSY